MGTPTFAWSDFARSRYRPGGAHSYFNGDEAALLELVAAHWRSRRPGDGRDDLEAVVVVPVPATGFVCGTVLVEEHAGLSAELVRRQPGEEPYLRVLADGPREPARHAAVVLYSAATLLLNGGVRSSDADWEIVCVLASPVPVEPMDPLTMARNFLALPGGTPCDYTAAQFAEAIRYWSRRAAVRPAD